MSGRRGRRKKCAGYEEWFEGLMVGGFALVTQGFKLPAQTLQPSNPPFSTSPSKFHKMTNFQSKKLTTFLLLLFCAAGLFAQPKMTVDETAIKKVIQDETHWFNQRNYDKWAECIAQDEMAFFSWTTPFKGQDAVNMLKGWTNISREYKKMMASMPVRPTDQPAANFMFKISGDMAYVTFDEYGSADNSVRVLEKVSGQWKILRMESLDVEDFRKFHQLYDLQRFAGDYEWDLSSRQIKVGTPSGKMTSAQVKIVETPYGIKVEFFMHSIDQSGSYQLQYFQDSYNYNMPTGKISVASVGNDMVAWAGEGAFDTNGDLAYEVTQPGDKSKTRGVGKLHRNADGSVVNSWTMYDENGKVTWDEIVPMTLKGVGKQP